MKLQFNKLYFSITITLFVLEFCIALFVHDRIVRPYIGDFLVVILIYCCIKSFLNLPVLKTAISVLLFSYIVEVLQYLHIVNILGLQDYRIARIIIGSSFEWTDLLAYTLGIVLVLVIEKQYSDRNELVY